MNESVRLAKEGIQSNMSGKVPYELIIIGGGLSGLSAGAMWMKNNPGSRTLIVEKNPYPGGYCTAYRRRGYVFETTQLMPDIVDILEYLGIDLPLREYSSTLMRRVVVHGSEKDEYRIPAGTGRFVAYLSSLFPDSSDKIASFMDYCDELFRQIGKVKAFPNFIDTLLTPVRASRVVANLNTTFSDLLDRFGIRDKRLREIMETFTSFSGVPPGRASSILTAGAMLAAMKRSFRTKGYFDEFPAALARKYQELGGELLLESPVERIEIRRGTAVGVRIRGINQPALAGHIVSTVDPMLAMRKLVGDAHLPAKYITRLEETVMSHSTFTVSLGLDEGVRLEALDLDFPYNLVSTGLGTADKLYTAFLKGGHGFSRNCFHVGISAPTLTTGGKPTLTVAAAPLALDRWKVHRETNYRLYRKMKEEFGDFLIDVAGQYFVPGIRDHIVLKDISTPATYARYSGSPTGSIYDMASLVSQFGPRRLPMKTPVKNLYQPKFSHGLYGAMMNGVQVVDLMMQRKFNHGNSLFSPDSK